MTLLFLLALLVLSLGGVLGEESSCSQAETEQTLTTVLFRRLSGNFQEAHELLDEHVKACPLATAALLQLAESYAQRRENAQAVNVLLRAIESNSTLAVQAGATKRLQKLLAAPASAQQSDEWSRIEYVIPPAKRKDPAFESAVSLHWSVPFWFIDNIELDFRTALVEEALALAKSTPSAPSPTVRGGWQSRGDLLSSASASSSAAGALFQSLRTHVQSRVASLLRTTADFTLLAGQVQVLSGWLNVDQKGHAHAPISRPQFTNGRHARDQLTVLVCLEAGEQAEPDLSFADPRPQAAPLQLSNWFQLDNPLRFSLVPNRLFMFPPWLRRSVFANGSPSGRPRVLATFEVAVPGFELWSIEQRAAKLATVAVDARGSGAESALFAQQTLSGPLPSSQLLFRWPTPLFVYVDPMLAGDSTSNTLAATADAPAVHKATAQDTRKGSVAGSLPGQAPSPASSGADSDSRKPSGTISHRLDGGADDTLGRQPVGTLPSKIDGVTLAAGGDESKPRAQFNERLKALLEWLSTKQTGFRRSNKGGWQSEPNLFDYSATQNASFAVLEQLRSHTYAAVLRFLDHLATHSFLHKFPHTYAPPEPKAGELYITIQYAWGAINRAGHYNAPHTHPESFLSGVYYISNGNDAESSIHFVDPTPHEHSACVDSQATCSISDLRVRTEPGKLVLFPSWLEHYVLPHNPTNSTEPRANNNRVALSFNVRVVHKDDRTRPPPMSWLLPTSHSRGVASLLSVLAKQNSPT